MMRLGPDLMKLGSTKPSEVPKIILGYPYNHILKVSGHYLHLLPSYKGRKNKPLTGERRGEQRAERERTWVIIHTLPKSHLLGKGCAISAQNFQGIFLSVNKHHS